MFGINRFNAITHFICEFVFRYTAKTLELSPTTVSVVSAGRRIPAMTLVSTRDG